MKGGEGERGRGRIKQMKRCSGPKYAQRESNDEIKKERKRELEKESSG